MNSIQGHSTNGASGTSRNRGGSRPGAGRPPGVLSKITLDVKAYASDFSREAIDGLVSIARNPNEAGATRVAAWKEVLDRGCGRPPPFQINGDVHIHPQIQGLPLYQTLETQVLDLKPEKDD